MPIHLVSPIPGRRNSACRNHVVPFRGTQLISYGLRSPPVEQPPCGAWPYAWPRTAHWCRGTRPSPRPKRPMSEDSTSSQVRIRLLSLYSSVPGLYAFWEDHVGGKYKVWTFCGPSTWKVRFVLRSEYPKHLTTHCETRWFWSAKAR